MARPKHNLMFSAYSRSMIKLFPLFFLILNCKWWRSLSATVTWSNITAQQNCLITALVEEPIVEIDLHLNKKYRWGFFDSLRELVPAFPATPPFQTMATKFSYFLYDTSSTNLMSDHCKEDLQQSDLCPEFAGDVANDQWIFCCECIEHMLNLSWCLRMRP